MTVFFALLLKLIPLYLLILLGMIGGRYLNVGKETVATMLIYLIAPVVFFHGVVTAHITWSLLSLPVLFYALTVFFCLTTYALTKRVFNDSTRNLLSYTAATGNSGYFGIPVALALFGESAMGTLIVTALAFTLFETTFGYYMMARGHHTVRDSFFKVLKLPGLYACALGLVVNLSHVPLGQTYVDFALAFRGAFTVLGMMMIGLGLSSLQHVKIDLTYISIAFIAKFVAWPAVIAGVIWTDVTYLHVYDPLAHKVMILLSIIPLAANTVTFATQLKIHPEKAATAVLLSTVFALFYIPLVATLVF